MTCTLVPGPPGPVSYVAGSKWPAGLRVDIESRKIVVLWFAKLDATIMHSSCEIKISALPLALVPIAFGWVG